MVELGRVERACSLLAVAALVSGCGGGGGGGGASAAAAPAASSATQDPTSPLVEASAEAVPLADGSFDLVLSEYGASIWCDPAAWIPEAARLLRPGGRLVFLCNSTLAILCSPDEGRVEEQLARPQFGMWRFEWDGGVEFHLAHGDCIRLLRESGFDVDRLVELQAPAEAADHPYYDFVGADWARRWPAEEIWVARKKAPLAVPVSGRAGCARASV